MSWIAVNGFSNQEVSRQLMLGAPKGEMLSRGSIVCEFEPETPDPSRLVHYQFFEYWDHGFSLHRNPDGSASLRIQQGPDETYSRLSGFGVACTDPIRLTYCWDAPAGHGHLSAENLKTGGIQQVPVRRPIALPVRDGLRAIGSGLECFVDTSVKLLALADHMVPVGPGAAIDASAQVATPLGSRQVKDLSPGDEVLTKTKGAMPVHRVIHQSVPAIGHARPVLLRKPFFGLTQDLVVAANQRLLIFGVETEYNFGKDSMLLNAGELMGLPGVSYLGDQDMVEYAQVLLGSHECIQVSGAWTESLFIGRLAMEPPIARTSVIADVPASELPVHRRRAHPILQDYERRALFGAMIA